MRTTTKKLIERLMKLLDDANELMDDISFEINDENSDAIILDTLLDDVTELEAEISECVYSNHTQYHLLDKSWYDILNEILESEVK